MLLELPRKAKAEEALLNKAIYFLQQTLLRLSGPFTKKVLEEDLNYIEVHRLEHSNKHDAFDEDKLVGDGCRGVRGACSRMEDHT